MVKEVAWVLATGRSGDLPRAWGWLMRLITRHDFLEFGNNWSGVALAGQGFELLYVAGEGGAFYGVVPSGDEDFFVFGGVGFLSLGEEFFAQFFPRARLGEDDVDVALGFEAREADQFLRQLDDADLFPHV